MITGEVLAKSKSKSQSLYIARVLRSRSSCVKLTLSLSPLRASQEDWDRDIVV